MPNDHCFRLQRMDPWKRFRPRNCRRQECDIVQSYSHRQGVRISCSYVVNLIQKYLRIICRVLLRKVTANDKALGVANLSFWRVSRKGVMAASAFDVCRSHRRTFERRLQSFCRRDEDFWIVSLVVRPFVKGEMHNRSTTEWNCGRATSAKPIWMHDSLLLRCCMFIRMLN